MMKKKKHLMTLGCLVMGILVLSSGVYANYDDAKGYTNYKEALKQLAFEETNFSADFAVSVAIDGQEFQNVGEQIKWNKGETYSKSTYSDQLVNGGDQRIEESYRKGGKNIYYNVNQNSYAEYENYSGDEETFIDLGNDATSKKAVRFAELLGDTLVGDLKNNVVLDSIDEDGVRNYSINVKANQIPEVVNAGLSLMFGANSEYTTEDDMYGKFEDDAHIGKVICKVSLDKEGRLVANYLEADLIGTDENGQKHTATMKIDAKVFDYGKTAVPDFDPEGKTKTE